LDFAYGAAHEALRAGLTALHARNGAPTRLRAGADAREDPFDPTLWAALQDALRGPLGDADPRAARLAATVAAECAGVALAPLPLSGALAAWAAGVTAPDAPLARVALTRAPAEPSLRVTGGRAAGVLEVVSDGPGAELLLATCGADVLVVDLAGRGVTRTPLASLDLAHGVARIVLDEAPCRTVPGAGARLAAIAAVFAAFEQVGGAQRCLDVAAAYAKERYAFGQPIGAFQAVKHALARLHVEVELARSNAWYAAWALAEDAPELIVAACLARLSATPAYLDAAQECIHLHGGVGFTWAHEGHLHLRRARALEAALGSAAAWAECLLAQPGAVPGWAVA
jgi:acyl-CoA dehydrogenase